MNYRQIYQAQTISRRGGYNSYLQMKPQIKINYKSTCSNAGVPPGDDGEGVGRLGKAPLPGRQPPASPAHSLRNGSGFIKDRETQVHISFLTLYLEIKWAKERVCVCPCVLYLLHYLKGRDYSAIPTFIYFSGVCVGGGGVDTWNFLLLNIDRTLHFTQNKYSETNLIRAHEYLS